MLSSFEFQRLQQSTVRPAWEGEGGGAWRYNQVRAGVEVVAGRCLRGLVDVVA